MPWNGSCSSWINIGHFQVFGLVSLDRFLWNSSRPLCQAFKFDFS